MMAVVPPMFVVSAATLTAPLKVVVVVLLAASVKAAPVTLLPESSVIVPMTLKMPPPSPGLPLVFTELFVMVLLMSVARALLFNNPPPALPAELPVIWLLFMTRLPPSPL